MTERTALEIALDLDAASCSSFVKLEAAEALRKQHAEIGRLRDGLSVIANGRCADVYADRVLMRLKMKLTERELWLMRQAFNDGVCAENFDAWVNDSAADGVTVADVLAKDAPPETVVEEFLRRTGQYVTNDASREAAIAAAVAAEREACAAVCIAQADRLEGPSDACGIALVCAGLIRARSAT